MCLFFFFQAEDGIRDRISDWSSDVCSSDLDGFFVTGDLGKQDSAGYLHIVGRSKDLVITGGYNVYPKEIESEIDLLAGVVESAVIGVPHPDFGEGVTAVVIGTVDEAAILAGLAGRLAKYKIPKRVLIVDDLPRNGLGKVQKNLLRQTYNNQIGRAHV